MFNRLLFLFLLINELRTSDQVTIIIVTEVKTVNSCIVVSLVQSDH